MAENRIDKRFKELKSENRKALITFITAGDGGYELTEKAVLNMAESGADLIELGVPFSDPIAEGPVIQKASERALKNGTTLEGIFKMIERIRQKTQVPLLLMMYLNTIFVYGTERFFAQCKETGIDGVIVPDMPFEEKDEIQGAADKYGIHNISLVTPASEGRIQMISADATGFLYCVSSNGVTGMRSKFDTDFSSFFAPIHKYAKLPCAVGFGISSPESAKHMSQYCDGVIIGSAIVHLVEEYKENAVAEIEKFVTSIRTALDEV